MGGEDIADDDLVWTQPVVASDESDGGDSVADDAAGDDDVVDKAAATEPARKKAKTPQQLLIQAGRDLEQQDTKEQAVFLSTAMSHYRLLAATNDDSREKKVEIQPHHLVKAKEGDTLVDRIRNVVSFKRMKQWKHKSCPCVLIVCISARRAVAVLKELSPLKLRAFKLFPKSGSITDQTRILQGAAPCPIVVGTPHRLLQLADVLSLDQTQLIVLDGQCSNKQYTVCTLPDTAPHCMSFLERVVLEQVRKRNNCKLAFF